jgi:signal transduction histidine kinase
MELDLQTFDVRKMVDEMISTIDAVVRKNGNTLAVTLAEDLGSLHGDPTKTRQILSQPPQQRREFTHDGTVRLAVARRSVAGVDHCVEFVVTDTGIGLTDEQKAKLFRPFVRRLDRPQVRRHRLGSRSRRASALMKGE